MKVTQKMALGILFLMLVTAKIFSQNNSNYPLSGTSQHLEILKTLNPGLEEKMEQLEFERAQRLARKFEIEQRQNSLHQARKDLGDGEIYTIPVVIHVIEAPGTQPGDANYISDAEFQQSISQLNSLFTYINVNNPTVELPAEIQFCLAKQDKDGEFTTAILRYQNQFSTVDIAQDFAMKDEILNAPSNLNGLGEFLFPHENYMNVYVVNSIDGNAGDGNVAGYATLASTITQNPTQKVYDGIVMEGSFMYGGEDSTKILVHEAGHYLDLYHTFGKNGTDVCDEVNGNLNCLLDGDNVCDTLPDSRASPGICNLQDNSCGSDINDPSPMNPYRPIASGGLGDVVDMVQNYMDYSDKSCQSYFTAGQVDRMIDAIETFRPGFISPSNLACNTVFTNPIALDIQLTGSLDEQPAGQILNFNNLTTDIVSGNFPVGYEFHWDFGDGTTLITTTELIVNHT